MALKSFKDYRKQVSYASLGVVAPVNETTVPEHLQYVPDTWDHHTNVDEDTSDKMDKAFSGKGWTSFPLENHSATDDMDPDVAEHLTRHGWEVKDYGKGLATKKTRVGNPKAGIPEREKYVDEKIGSILEKTNAPENVKKAYMADPARAASKLNLGGNKGLHVVMSTTPLAIAGMTTGTNWKNQSCMNMEGGAYHHKLRNDSENGTHVAFLVHHDDVKPEPDRPIARIALKPFHTDGNDSGERDTIFRPEGRHYGAGSTQFTHAVHEWATRNYPAKTGETYTKNRHVYDDDGVSEFVAESHKTIKEKVENLDDIVPSRNMSLDKGLIDAAIVHGDNFHKEPINRARFVRKMADVSNLNAQHVSKLLRMAPTEAHTLAVSHGDKFSTDALNDYINQTGGHTRKLLMNPKLHDSYIDKLDPSDYTSVRRSKLKPHHYDKVVDAYNNNASGSYYALSDHMQHLSSDHIHKLIEGGNRKSVNGKPLLSDDLFRMLPNAKNFNEEHHDALVDSLVKIPNQKAANELTSNSKFMTLDHAKVIKSNLDKLKSNPHLPESEHAKIAKDFVSEMAKPYSAPGAAKYQTKTETNAGYSTFNIPEHISKHFSDADYDTMAKVGRDMRFQSPEHSNKYLDHITKLADDAHDKYSHEFDKAQEKHEEESDDEFDPEEHEHLTKLKDAFHSHLETLGNNIENHIEKHVDDGDGFIKSYKEHDKTSDRINDLDKYDHYNTPNNSNRYDDQDHFEDNFADHVDKLYELHNNTENRNEW